MFMGALPSVQTLFFHLSHVFLCSTWYLSLDVHAFVNVLYEALSVFRNMNSTCSLEASRVLYIYPFYCSPPEQECQFSHGREPVRTLLPIKKVSIAWCGLYAMQWAAEAEVTLNCHILWALPLSYFTFFPQLSYLFTFSHVNWITFSNFIQFSIFVGMFKNVGNSVSGMICCANIYLAHIWIICDTKSHRLQPKDINT